MKSVWRVLFASSFVVGLLAGAAKPSLAHQVFESQFSYYTPNSHCTWTGSINDHTKIEGQVESKQWVNVGGYGEACAGALQRSPGNIKVKLNVFQKTSTTSWGLCWATVEVFNSATTYRVVGVNQSPPNQCGAGTYRVEALGHVNVNGVWYGGPVWAYHDY